MAHSKRYLAVGSLFAVVLTILFACGGGGGGGGGLSGNLLGTVTDATQMAVDGATVTVYDDTGVVTVVVSTTTTDAAGRYAFNITTMGNYLVSAEMAPAFFPAGRSVTLVANRNTVADLNLSSTRDRASQEVQSTDVVSTVGATVESSTYLGGTDRASIDIAAASLETVPAVPFIGTAVVYLTPVDTTEIDSGFTDYQNVLVVGLGDPVPTGSVLKVYAAAGVAVVDGVGSALTADVATPMTLSMPIPADPTTLRDDAPASVPLWKYDPTQARWEETDGLTATRDLVDTEFYNADITEGGLYAAGEVALATAVTGTLQYNDAATAAGGVTVIASGVDATYRSVTTTDDNGFFSVPVEDLMQTEIEFVSMGLGVQRTDSVLAVAPAALGTIVMADISSSGEVVLHLNDTSSTGFIPASGRIYVDPDSVFYTADIADVVFVASTSDSDFGGTTLTLDVGVGGYPLVDRLLNPLDATQIKLSGAAAFDPAVTRIRIDGATPISINVQTVDKHSATITINSAILSAGVWTVTMSSSFSL